MNKLVQQSRLVRQARPARPAPRNYKDGPKPTFLGNLPFVNLSARAVKDRSFWNVPAVDDYGTACELGRDYGAHFAQYLKDTPYMVGSNVLASVLPAIDFKDPTAAKGFWVGFFPYLEYLIYKGTQGVDVFEHVEKLQSLYQGVVERRATEEVAA